MYTFTNGSSSFLNSKVQGVPEKVKKVIREALNKKTVNRVTFINLGLTPPPPLG